MSEEFDQYRMGHLVSNAEIWKRLGELGVNEESLLDFDFQFAAKTKTAADQLVNTLDSYKFKTELSGIFKKTYALSSNTGAISWTEEVLLKWVDFMISIGEDCDCTFEGCGANVSS